MGLLSDPEYGSKWIRILKKAHKPLCFVCYVGAVIWFFLLANNEFNNETYFSENALLPGLVTNEFNAENSAKQFYNKLILEMESKYHDTNQIPVPWLVGKMSQLHLEVYTHNFTLHYPLGRHQTFTGTNVYGILRAARTPSLEAIVVSAPYRALNSHHKGTTAGIALMLAFAQFARPQNYWAKDIIFLVTEHEQLGMQAWLEAYHGIHSDAETFYKTLGSYWKPGSTAWDFTKLTETLGLQSNHQKCLDPGKLKGRSGSIQAAINLEINLPKMKYIEVKVEGLNGQLPNLDLVNLVHKLCFKSGLHHSYKNSFSWLRRGSKMDEWQNNISTMLGMVFSLIAGVPSGNHGLFHRFGIEAVTLEGRDSNDPVVPQMRLHAVSPASFYRLGMALESILRSLNNLLERFHQSYFFYMLAASNRFISIGEYMPSLCLLCVAILVRALSFWVSIQMQPDDETTHKPTQKPTESKDGLTQTNTKSTSAADAGDFVDSAEENIEKVKKKKGTSSTNIRQEDEGWKTSSTESKQAGKGKITTWTEIKQASEGKKSSQISEIIPEESEEIIAEFHYLADSSVGNELGDQEQNKSFDENEYESFPESESEIRGSSEKKEYADKSTQIPRKRRRSRPISVVNVGLNYLIVHLFGYAVMSSPVILSKIGLEIQGFATDKSIYYGLFAILLLLLIVIPLLPKLIYQNNISYEEFCLVNILLLIELATLCLCVGMQNFSLGFAIAVLYTPLALLLEVDDGSKKNRYAVFLKRVLCFLLNPLCVVVISMIVYSCILYPEESISRVLSRGNDAAMKAVTFSVSDSLIYGNWLFNVVCVVLLPVHLIFWQIALCKCSLKPKRA